MTEFANTQAHQKPAASGIMNGLLKRQCACGQHTGGGECESCRKKNSADNVAGADLLPPVGSGALRAPFVKLNRLGDQHEQEADRMIARVLRGPDPLNSSLATPTERERKEEEREPSRSTLSRISGVIQRRVADPAREDEIRRKLEQLGIFPPAVSQITASIQALQGSGQPIPDRLLAVLETRFGADFSQVRIHTSSTMAQLAAMLNARAFTLGRHIVFGVGEYAPDTPEGRVLLVHELAHILQQVGYVEQPITRRQPAGGAQGAGQEDAATNLATEPEAVQGEQPVAPQPAAATTSTTAGTQAVPAMQPPQQEPVATPGIEPNEKAPASPEQDPDYQTVAAQVKIRAVGQKTPPIVSPSRGETVPEDQIRQVAQETSQKKKTDMVSAAQLPRERKREQSKKATHLEQVAQQEKAQPRFTLQEFMLAFEATSNKLGKSLPENRDQRGSVAKIIEMSREKAAATQELARQKQTRSGTVQAILKDPASAPGDLETEPPELIKDDPGRAPSLQRAGTAAPKPKTDEETSLDDKSRALDDTLTNHSVGGQTIHIDEDSLAYSKSGEKSFDEAGQAKRHAQSEIDKARPRYRQAEGGVIAKSQADLRSVVNTGLQQQNQTRSTRFGEILGKQKLSEGKIVGEKQRIFGVFQGIYTKTKENVDRELKSLEGIETALEPIISSAEKNFESSARQQLEYIYTPGMFDYSDWKDEPKVKAALKEKYDTYRRQSKNHFQALNRAYKEVRDQSAEEYFRYIKANFIYEVKRDVENQIARRVVDTLNAARQHIADGEEKAKAEFNKLSEPEKKEAQDVYDAAKEKFASLGESVDERKTEIINDMARVYNQSVSKLDAKFEEIKKDVLTRWYEKAWNKLKAIVNAIIEFATRIGELLGRLVYLVGDIIASPGTFFRNLGTGISQGFSTFIGRIDVYLVTAFFDWLRGSSSVPIQIPSELGPKSLFGLFTQLLGLSTETVWERMEVIYDQTIANTFRRGEALVEKGLVIFAIIKNEGLGGLWDQIKESLGNIFDETLENVKEAVLYAAIKKIIVEIGKMLIPGGGFIILAGKVIRLLKFIWEARNHILDLIESFVDSVEMAVKGNIQGIVAHIIRALTKFITIAIDFLVTLFGLGSLKEKAERIIGRVRRPVVQAIDWLLRKLRPLVMRVFRRKEPSVAERPDRQQLDKEEAKEPARTEVQTDITLAKQTLRKALDTQLPNGARQTADVDQVLAGVASRVKPALTGMRAEEVLPGKPKAEGAIGFKVRAKLQTGKDSIVDTVRFSEKGQVLDHEERWALGVKGVKRAVSQLEKRSISEDAIKAQLPRWQADFGFSALFLNMQESPWWIEGEMSARRRVTALPPVTADPNVPMRSAAGIGAIQQHGKKRSSLRDEAKIWWIESEHILPFATGKTLWQAMALYLPERGWPEDNRQTTIMIYYEAARFKTPTDNQVSDLFKSAIDRLDISRTFQRQVDQYRSGDTRALESGRAVLSGVLTALQAARVNAVSRTNRAIVQENRMKEEGYQLSNGERRAPTGRREPAIPSSDAVDGASIQQYDDVLELVTVELYSAEELRHKVEKIEGRRPGGL